MKSKGFTLIDLLVIIAIVGISISIITSAVKKKSEQTEYQPTTEEGCKIEKIDCRYECIDEYNMEKLEYCLTKCDLRYENCIDNLHLDF